MSFDCIKLTKADGTEWLVVRHYWEGEFQGERSEQLSNWHAESYLQTRDRLIKDLTRGEKHGKH